MQEKEIPPVGKTTDVEVKPETTEVPPEIERSPGSQTPQTQPTDQTSDDSTQAQPQDDSTPKIAIQPPASAAQLDDWSKGPIESALTWFAAFWIRIIKKALHFGWKILGGNSKD